MKPIGPPARSIVLEKRNRSLGWAKAIGELIDNSVGNGAHNIVVRFLPHRCEVRDDGVGCCERMFAALASLGWHQEDASVKNSVSRFGIGAKDAFMWAGGPTYLYSRRAGISRYLAVDWDSFGTHWDYDEPQVGEPAEKFCRDVGLFDGHGTIVVMPHHTRQMQERHFMDLRKAMNATHWAAVETGVSIRLEYKRPGKRGKIIGGVLPGSPMPQLIEGMHIKDDVALADGRRIRIEGGVLSPEERKSDPGFEYIFGHRVVIAAGGIGAGDMEFERVYFRVYLNGDKEDWRVTTNKDGLHDADEAALGQVVFTHCQHLLAKAASEAVGELHDRELLEDISDCLTNAQKRRAKRHPGSQHGTVSPNGKGKGGKHRNARNVSDEDGPIETGRSGRIKFHICEFEDSNAHLLGLAKVKDRIVRLNKRHKYIASVMQDRNRDAMFLLALSLWSEAWTRTEDNGQIRLSRKCDFVDKLSAMLVFKEEPTTATN